MSGLNAEISAQGLQTEADLGNSGGQSIQANTIAEKPIKFYLNHPQIHLHIKSYYLGVATPDNQHEYDMLLDSLKTDNAETRPFYFFVLLRMMQLADLESSRYIAPHIRSFAERRPDEFYAYVDQNARLVSDEVWVNYLAFTFIQNDPYNTVDYFVRMQKENCPGCEDYVMQQIEQYADSIRKELGY
jgi:hypothetical protein